MQAEAPTEALVTASLRRRFVAQVVDLLVLAPILLIEIFFLWESRTFFWASAVMYAGYWIVFTSLAGGTPGKLLLGIYVGDQAGRRIGLVRSSMRRLAFELFYIGFLWPPLVIVAFFSPIPSFLMALLDPQRRALHDRIAGTRVLRGKALPRL